MHHAGVRTFPQFWLPDSCDRFTGTNVCSFLYGVYGFPSCPEYSFPDRGPEAVCISRYTQEHTRPRAQCAATSGPVCVCTCVWEGACHQALISSCYPGLISKKSKWSRGKASEDGRLPLRMWLTVIVALWAVSPAGRTRGFRNPGLGGAVSSQILPP